MPTQSRLHRPLARHITAQAQSAQQVEGLQVIAGVVFRARKRKPADAPAARLAIAEQPALIASLDRDGHRAITDAAWQGDAASVALMLELGFDPATPGHDSGTALHCAAWQGSADTVAALLRAPAVLALLVVRDATYDSTPLGWCCHGSINGPHGAEYAQVARLLLEAGARVEVLDGSEEVEAVLTGWSATS